ncbi:hypothetical protein [Rhizorhabdus dicambivorans]|uniref:Glycosyltransferase RgtA/B/C/D-like domain-containing protein n=1 Tax=Rhizorhabdus dicambivorans TaxID=1850238 RepID=A0A2A4FTL1_9SPHN|nr:hypothetical protein [Rhizorhabdus dicambivorans]ATE66472.1 hypothetical protein CMV14_20390 [Rhizorhabdus dicambivorans]PCE41036.1 hypothetical protein COO09_16930 [Rhizorhabdus dicambivorans]
MSDRPFPIDPLPRRSLWAVLAAAAAIGLALRIAAAQGDYWLDEAWSLLFAREARSPGDVFFAINHDNNHFLNTLWLQLVGWGGSPLLGRALSIACGTAGVVVAGLIGARRGLRGAALAASLFAVSPILVTYGSEARGYAPMLLALLCAIRIVDRELFGVPVRHAPLLLGIATLAGMLAHASMLFGVAALSGWVAIEQGRRLGHAAGALATLRLMGRAVAAVLAVLLIVAAGAAASPEGFRMGSLAPFDWPAFVDALDHMLAFTIGWPLLVGPWLIFFLFLPLGLRRAPLLSERAPFHLLAILGLPLLVAILEPGNSAFPRYYLLSAVALLLLLAELAAVRGRAARLLFGAVMIGSLILDGHIIANLRGDPGLAIEVMSQRAPDGGAVMLQAERDGPVLEAAASRRAYPLILTNDCAEARFYYIADNGTQPFPLAALRCGAAFQPIAGRDLDGLSSQAWQLYERVDR